MAARTNPRREKLIESARKIAAATGEQHLDPEILFGRASDDDLDRYTPEMLALSAIHSAKELSAWDGKTPRVSIEALPNVEPGGVAVSVLSITDRNMPFLYELVMGEVTSTYRDLYMAVHPILVMEHGKAPALYSAEEPSDPETRVSHIQLHISPADRESNPPISGSACSWCWSRFIRRFPTGSRCFPSSTRSSPSSAATVPAARRPTATRQSLS